MNGPYEPLIRLTEQTIPAAIAFTFAGFVVLLLLWIGHKYG